MEAALLVGFAYAFRFQLVRAPHGCLCVRACAQCIGDRAVSQRAGTVAHAKRRQAPRAALQFTKNAFALGFLLILEVSLAMAAFGFFIAAFLRKVRGARCSIHTQLMPHDARHE